MLMSRGHTFWTFPKGHSMKKRLNALKNLENAFLTLKGGVNFAAALGRPFLAEFLS